MASDEESLDNMDETRNQETEDMAREIFEYIKARDKDAKVWGDEIDQRGCNEQAHDCGKQPSNYAFYDERTAYEAI